MSVRAAATTDIPASAAHRLGAFAFERPRKPFAPTPASRISIESVARDQHVLAGSGIDWGTGMDCLAIVVARVPGVACVVGLDIAMADIAIARRNANGNGVADAAGFEIVDSYVPATSSVHRRLDELRNTTTFILANSPASAVRWPSWSRQRLRYRWA